MSRPTAPPLLPSTFCRWSKHSEDLAALALNRPRKPCPSDGFVSLLKHLDKLLAAMGI